MAHLKPAGTQLTATLLCLASISCALAGPPVEHGQGEMAGEVTASSVILQSRLTAGSQLVDGDLPGATGIARFEIATDKNFEHARLTDLIDIDASVSGHEQGYSGWVQLPDGRIFVAHYTDDTSEAGTPNPHQFGIPWIRGNFLELADLPPLPNR